MRLARTLKSYSSSPALLDGMRRRRLFWLGATFSLIVLVVFALGRSGLRHLLAEGVQLRFDTVQHLPVERAATARAGVGPPLFLDVRSRAEYLAGHIRGAQWIEPTTNPSTALSELPKNRPIVAYCSVGWRSSRLAERLQAAGFSQVANLKGGLFEWTARGYEVVREGQLTNQIHPYGWPWSLLLADTQRAPP